MNIYIYIYVYIHIFMYVYIFIYNEKKDSQPEFRGNYLQGFGNLYQQAKARIGS